MLFSKLEHGLREAAKPTRDAIVNLLPQVYANR
jgi:hypothetical protein